MALTIGIPIYPQFDTIDVAAPWDILSRVTRYSPNTPVELLLISNTCDLVLSGQGLQFQPTQTFADCPHLDVLFVPGTQNLDAIIGKNSAYFDFLRDRGSKATHVVGVCTGAVLLAEAGLLDGYRATTHWGALDRLRSYKNVTVVNGYPRWVENGNRFTTGGVSSSIDGSLRFVEILTHNAQAAKCIELEIQYNPHPPYATGDPAIADFETYDRVANS